jgi:hypothetical protein
MYGYSNQYAPASTGYSGYGAMQAPRTGGASIFGAEPSTLDNLKAFMEKETMGVKNKFLLAGAAALGVGYYGYTKGWF